MSVDYSAQQPTAMWNPARGVWEIPMENILCEHWGLFSATFPTSGMMRDGKLYPLHQQAHHTDVNVYSSLPTPVAQDSSGAMTVANRKLGGYGPALRDIADFLPTPQTGDGQKGMTSTPEHRQATGHQVMLCNHAPQLTESWGKFAPAIHQWETITGNPAPPPTIPDGRDGQARLNPAFAEWMMGLKPGWITECNITRNEQLKACGNGVVPQQASKAITQLLQGLAP
jgi:DNA (cytosine-5)-methyltransferase 1